MDPVQLQSPVVLYVKWRIVMEILNILSLFKTYQTENATYGLP